MPEGQYAGLLRVPGHQTRLMRCPEAPVAWLRRPSSLPILTTHGRARKTAQALETYAAEVLRLTREIEALTDGTSGWYRGMRTRVEAAETLWQRS